MRASSSAPALSRRNVMKGLACGLAGASVPVAALAGITASKLTSPDASIIERCARWKQRLEKLKAKEKQLRLLAEEAQKATPEVPAELFETIRVRGNYAASPYYGGARYREPWNKRRLGNVIKNKDGSLTATDECRAHVQRLICLIDERAAAKKRAWASHKRLDRQWERQLRKNEILLSTIMGQEAQTLQGTAAQIEVLQIDDVFLETSAGSSRLDDLMTNVRRLIAALPTEV